MNAAKNLRAVMDYFGITGSELSKALDVDPSLVSRWLAEKRKLKAASPVMDALAEYILSHSQRVRDIEWLKTQFEEDNLPTDALTVYRIKQNLILWLASDGDFLMENLGGALGCGLDTRTKASLPSESFMTDKQAEIGNVDIALGLEPIFTALSEGISLDIFLSSDDMATITDEAFSCLLLSEIDKVSVRLMVCITGNSKAMARLIDVYMRPIVSGHLILSVVRGMTQTVTNQMQLIIPQKYAVLITETPGNAASPVAVIISEKAFVREMQVSFENTIRYAQPVLNIYDDNYSRNILELLYMEFCTPGGLDVVKDSINPLYMTSGAYDNELRTHEHNEKEFAWRSEEFKRFKAGMDDTLKSGTAFREILSLSRLNQIAQDGFCLMPGLYFMKKGFLNLNAESCAAILEGYIRYLESVANFQLLVLDDIAALHMGSCWHIKQNVSLAVNYWSGTEPLMIHSDQILLVQEFQSHFDAVWAQGEGCIGSKSYVMGILKNILRRLSEKHLGQF